MTEKKNRLTFSQKKVRKDTEAHFHQVLRTEFGFCNEKSRTISIFIYDWLQFLWMRPAPAGGFRGFSKGDRLGLLFGFVEQGCVRNTKKTYRHKS